MTRSDAIFWIVTGTIALIIIGLLIFAPDAFA